MEQVTTNQVKEMIDQLAAMTAAASITPEIVASIFEKMRNLNDQEREKVIKVATEYIEEIRETGVDADKCRTNNESNVQAELDRLDVNVEKIQTTIGGFEGFSVDKLNSIISILDKHFLLIELRDDNIPPSGQNRTALCGSALCGYAICGTN